MSCTTCKLSYGGCCCLCLGCGLAGAAWDRLCSGCIEISLQHRHEVKKDLTSLELKDLKKQLRQYPPKVAYWGQYRKPILPHKFMPRWLVWAYGMKNYGESAILSQNKGRFNPTLFVASNKADKIDFLTLPWVSRRFMDILENPTRKCRHQVRRQALHSL